MSAPGGVELDEDVGMLLYKGGVVGIVEDDHVGVDEDDQEKEEDRSCDHIFVINYTYGLYYQEYKVLWY